MECCRKIHLEWFHGNIDWVCDLRNIKTSGLDSARGNVELSLMTIDMERLRDRCYRNFKDMIPYSTN